jgi:hypothetical protein
MVIFWRGLLACLIALCLTVTASAVTKVQVDTDSPQDVINKSVNGIVNVERFGASAAGAAGPNTTAIQSAADSLGSAGGTVFFPSMYDTNAPLVFKNRVILAGRGMEVSGINNTNASGAKAVHFTDSTTSNKELRYAGIRDLHIKGNSSSGAGVVVDNPYHFTLERTLIDLHGGIGVDFQKGVASSTYGQNIWIDQSWIEKNRGGGVRIIPTGASSGPNIAHILNSSINQNAFYGVYAKRQSVLTIRGSELGAYYYGALIGGHQAVPIVLNGGISILIENNSFENNGGNGASSYNYNIRPGYNGDTQANDTGENVQSLSVIDNDFTGSNTDNNGRLIVVRLANVEGFRFERNAVAKAGSDDMYGVEFVSAQLPDYVGIAFVLNQWSSTMTGRTLGSWKGSYLSMDVERDGVSGSNPYVYGFQSAASSNIGYNARLAGEANDRFQVRGDGSIWQGSGSTAPIQAWSPPSIFSALGTPANGIMKYCSDCTIANPCAGSGTGALAKRLNGVWVCN